MSVWFTNLCQHKDTFSPTFPEIVSYGLAMFKPNIALTSLLKFLARFSLSTVAIIISVSKFRYDMQHDTSVTTSKRYR